MGVFGKRGVTSKSGRRVVVRSADEPDAASLLELAQDGDRTASQFSVTLPEQRKLTVEKEIEYIREHRDAAGSVLIIAEINGRIVGAVGFKAHTQKRIAHHGMLGISVHSEFREDGIGRELLKATLDWAKAHPEIEKVSLCVFATNARAIHLYKSLGFREDCLRTKQVKFGPGEYVDDYEMSVWVK